MFRVIDDFSDNLKISKEDWCFILIQASEYLRDDTYFRKSAEKLYASDRDYFDGFIRQIRDTDTSNYRGNQTRCREVSVLLQGEHIMAVLAAVPTNEFIKKEVLRWVKHTRYRELFECLPCSNGKMQQKLFDMFARAYQEQTCELSVYVWGAVTLYKKEMGQQKTQALTFIVEKAITDLSRCANEDRSTDKSLKRVEEFKDSCLRVVTFDGEMGRAIVDAFYKTENVLALVADFNYAFSKLMGNKEAATAYYHGTQTTTTLLGKTVEVQQEFTGRFFVSQFDTEAEDVVNNKGFAQWLNKNKWFYEAITEFEFLIHHHGISYSLNTAYKGVEIGDDAWFAWFVHSFYKAKADNGAIPMCKLPFKEFFRIFMLALVMRLYRDSVGKARKYEEEEYFKRLEEEGKTGDKDYAEEIHKGRVQELESECELLRKQLQHSQTKLSQLEREKRSAQYKPTREATDRIEELEEEVKRLHQNDAELKELREAMYDLMNRDADTASEEEPVDEDLIQQVAKLLAEKKVGFVGGHENLHKKLHATFPSLLVYSGTTKGESFQKLQNADYVFLFVKHMNHPVYDKVTELLTANGVPFSYVQNVSIQNISNTIYGHLSA